MTPIVQCRGRNCPPKWECAHYWSLGLPNRAPVERLCEGKPTPEPIPKKESKVTSIQTIRAILQSRKRITALEAQAMCGVTKNGITRAFMRLRDSGEAVLVGRGPHAVWCRAEVADEVLREIEQRSAQIREATRLRAVERKRLRRHEELAAWSDIAPTQRIVPASLAKTPRVKVRSVWDLAA